MSMTDIKSNMHQQLEALFAQCSVPGCDGNAHYSARGRKGLCCSHYRRLSRHGSPLGGSTPHGAAQRWIRDVAVSCDVDGCLTWPFSGKGNGYGQINVGGKLLFAHRVVCEIVNGSPPTRRHFAAHSCGNGDLGCVNPKHLSWKTHVENCADTVAHGKSLRGERNPSSKITEAVARQILSLKGSKSQREIASLFGVSVGIVSNIHIGRNWFWVRPQSEGV